MHLALAIIRSRPAEVAGGVLAFAALLAVLVGFMVALPDAIPQQGISVAVLP